MFSSTGTHIKGGDTKTRSKHTDSKRRTTNKRAKSPVDASEPRQAIRVLIYSTSTPPSLLVLCMGKAEAVGINIWYVFVRSPDQDNLFELP